MSTMVDKDKVISEAAQCAQAHGEEVHAALTAYVGATSREDERWAEAILRKALVAQSVGVEPVAGNGGTHRARVDAACRALEAWDGRSMNEAPPRLANIRLGATVIRGSVAIMARLGWEVYTDAADAHEVGTGAGNVRELAEALSEGLSGDAALLRALAIVSRRNNESNAAHRQLEIASVEEKAAGMRLAAEREVTKRVNRG